MESKKQILNKNGFDFEEFEWDHEYSAKNLLLSMDEYKNLCLIEAIKEIEEIKRGQQNSYLEAKTEKEKEVHTHINMGLSLALGILKSEL